MHISGYLNFLLWCLMNWRVGGYYISDKGRAMKFEKLS